MVDMAIVEKSREELLVTISGMYVPGMTGDHFSGIVGGGVQALISTVVNACPDGHESEAIDTLIAMVGKMSDYAKKELVSRKQKGVM